MFLINSIFFSDSKEPKDPKEPKKSSTSGSLLSPKMQKSIKVNESQLMYLSERADGDKRIEGPLWKKSSSDKWQLRFFVLYQVSSTNKLIKVKRTSKAF